MRPVRQPRTIVRVPAAAVPSTKVVTAASGGGPRLNRLLEEIINWKKRVNSKLQQTAVTQQFLYDLLTEMKEGRLAASAKPLSGDSSGTQPRPIPAPLGPSTLTVRSTSKHVTTTHTSPDKMSRTTDYVEPGTVLHLHEPWTENETGVWMRTASGHWFQLWSRLTGTSFADG